MIDWKREPPATPSFTGKRLLNDVPLGDIVPYIDWTFFFAAWELKGRFPAILDHPQYGTAARELYQNAQVLLKRIVAERLLTAKGVYGFWPAATEGDDIVVYSDLERTGELTRFNMLRQQEAQADGKPNLSLADFVAGRGSSRSSMNKNNFWMAMLGVGLLVRAAAGQAPIYSETFPYPTGMTGNQPISAVGWANDLTSQFTRLYQNVAPDGTVV